MSAISKDELCPRCGAWKGIANTICENCYQKELEADAAVDARINALMFPLKKKSLLDGMTGKERKEYPIVSGCLDYFRDALLEVSHVSWLGNQKHNPGQPLHWARGKSTDEIDALGRHLACREQMDKIHPEHEAIEEAAQMAWRSLAFLQKLLEAKYNLELPPGCKDIPWFNGPRATPEGKPV